MNPNLESTNERSSRQVVAVVEGLLVAGTYRVATLLGRGSMGNVYAAEHVRLACPVAIKFLRTGVLADSWSSARFRDEARRVARLQHENIVRVFDCGELDDGTPFLVMEHLRGEDLRALLARERLLPIRRAVQIVTGACRGLAAVHSAGLVHRDLKPANLFVEQAANGSERCKVLDFGVAKSLESEATRPGALIGTVRYMAPEQLESAAAATAHADIYALGAILYEALTGEPVHTGETLQQQMFNILNGELRSPAERRPMPRELEQAILRALSRQPSERFENMEEMATALAPFGAVEPSSIPVRAADEETRRDTDESATVRRSQTGSKNQRAASLGVAAFCLGIAGGWQAREYRALAQPEPSGRFLARGHAQQAPAVAGRIVSSASAAVASGQLSSIAVAPSPSAATTPRVPATASRPSRLRANTVGAPPARQAGTTPLVERFDPRDPYE
jgi:serine/threonine protein kinase